MNLDSFYFYSVVSKNENQKKDEIEKVIELAERLRAFKSSTEVKSFLKEQWNLRDNINDFPIFQNVEITTNDSSKYFSVIVKQEDKISAYSYKN